MDYNIGDFEPPDGAQEPSPGNLGRSVLSRLHEMHELGAIAFHDSTSPLWLVTTGFCSSGSEPFAALYWVKRLYYYDEASRSMRMLFTPVEGSPAPCTIPSWPSGSERDVEFTFHDSEAFWAAWLVANTCLRLKLNTAVPSHQLEWWQSARLKNPRADMNLLLDATGFNRYVWSPRAEREYRTSHPHHPDEPTS
jgi:hypothetical protein